MPAYQKSISSSGTSEIIPINLKRFKFGVGLLVTFSSGASGTVSVEVTGDAVNSGPGGAIVGNTTGAASSIGPTHWNQHDVLKDLTESANSSLAYPCTAVRLNAVNIEDGTVTLAVVEAES